MGTGSRELRASQRDDRPKRFVVECWWAWPGGGCWMEVEERRFAFVTGAIARALASCEYQRGARVRVFDALTASPVWKSWEQVAPAAGKAKP